MNGGMHGMLYLTFIFLERAIMKIYIKVHLIHTGIYNSNVIQGCFEHILRILGCGMALTVRYLRLGG